MCLRSFARIKRKMVLMDKGQMESFLLIPLAQSAVKDYIPEVRIVFFKSEEDKNRPCNMRP